MVLLICKPKHKKQMDKVLVRKRSMENSLITTPLEYVSRKISLKCDHCGLLLKADDKSNRDKVMGGHLRHCLSNTKGLRMTTNFIPTVEEPRKWNHSTADHECGSLTWNLMIVEQMKVLVALKEIQLLSMHFN
jgi:hypothetical protein